MSEPSETTDSTPTVAELAEAARKMRTSLADTREWLMSLRPTTSRTARIERLRHAEREAAQLERVLTRCAEGKLQPQGDGSYVDSQGNVFRATPGGGWQLQEKP